MKEITSITKMIFAKSLMFGKRQDFCEKFKIDYHSIKEWNDMFKNLDNTLGIRTEQEIIEFEVHQQMLPVFTSTWSFIKNVKIELDWEHKKPIKKLTKAEMREIENIIDGE
jgi:hypothetical protein